MLLGCKTAENGYSEMPQNRYDLAKVYNEYLNSISPLDTAIVLKLNCSGMCNRGLENSIFLFSKRNKTTEVVRISNHRKYKNILLTDSGIAWASIIANFNDFKSDNIKTYEDVILDNRILRKQLHGSDGNTQSLALSFGQSKHNIYLGSLVIYSNEENKNVILINQLTEIANNLNWEPSEKIKYKMER